MHSLTVSMGSFLRDKNENYGFLSIVISSRVLESIGNLALGDLSRFECDLDSLLILLAQLVETVELICAGELSFYVGPDLGGDAVEVSPRVGDASADLDHRAES